MGLPENVEEVRETLRKIQKNLECPICLELLSDPYTTQCSHPFCRTCIYTVISSTREAKCPLCKMPISRRSMNENVRLAEIVEAVKELEHAITKDSGVPSTPPRPLPPHSHEATGTPGVVIHSLLHPTPQKPPGTPREVTITGQDSGNRNSRYELRPAVVESALTGRHRKRIRFASAKPTSRRKIPRLESTISNQAALLQALEEVDFAEPDVTSNSFVCTKSEDRRVQNVSAIPQLEVAGEEEETGGGTASVEREAGLNSPERKRPRRENPNDGFESITTVLETPAMVVVRSDPLEPLVHTLRPLASKSQTDSVSSHFNQDGEPAGVASTSQSQRTAHSPGPAPGGNASSCAMGELVGHTTLSTHSDEMTSQIKTVQETPCVHGGSQHQRMRDQCCGAVTPDPESHLELPPHKQENLDSDTTVLAEETQFTEPSTSMQANAAGSAAAGSATPCLVEETQVVSGHSQNAPQEIPVQTVIPPMPMGDAYEQGPPQVHCIGETQPECQTHEVRSVSVPAASNSPSMGEGDSTVSLGPASLIVKSSPTCLATPQPSLGPKPEGDENLDSTNSTTPDLYPECLQNGLQTSPTMSSTQANAPTCSSPRSAQVTILPPPFVSPPLTTTTSQCHNTSHSANLMVSSVPYSISPSIPLQNNYTSSAALRSNPTLDKTVVPDTFCTVKSGVSKLSETQLESVPSSQLSPVVLAIHSPPLPGLYKTLNGCLSRSVREHDATSSPSSHGDKSSPTDGKSDGTLPNQPSQDSVPLVPTFLQPTNSQVTPSGEGCPPPSLPDSLTVIPDSLLPLTKYQPSPSHDSTAQLSPRGTGNAAAELSVSAGSSSNTLQRSSGGMLSPGRDTCTQWDVKYSAFSQELTSQELEVLRQQMEEKEREVLELEALLLQGKKHPSAETNGSVSKISDSEGTCSHCQPGNSQPTATKNGKTSPDSPTHTSSPAAHQSPEITVIGETIPDSLPAVTMSEGARISPIHLVVPDSNEPSSNDNKVDCGQDRPRRMVSTSNAIILKTDGQPTTQDSSVASSYPVTQTRALVEKAGVLIESLQQPLPLTETSRSPHAHHSTREVDLEEPRCLSLSVVQTVSKGNGRIATPLTSQKEKEKNRTHAQGRISSRKPAGSNWLKKPSPKTSDEVLETANKLIKALRGPPKVVLESQTTLEVDTGFFNVSPSAGRSAAVQPKAQGSTKQQRNTKNRSPIPTPARQKASVPSKPKKKKRPLVVLGSQDVERSSPPPHDVPHGVPLPSNHPFLSISTSPRCQTTSKQNVYYPWVSEAAATVGKVSGTPAGPCEEACSPGNQHKSACDSSTSKDEAFPREQQDLHMMDGKTECIPSAVGTPCIQLRGSIRSAGSHHTKPPSFIASGLTKPQLCQTQILAKNHGGRIASCFNGSTTHIIVLTDENGCCPRTVKYLQGLAAGKWIVGHNWVKDSLEAGVLLPEAGYEVRGDSVCGGHPPCRAHKLRGAGEPGLFHHYNFYLAGQFDGISQDHLAQLIQLADGTLTQTFPGAMDSRTILICDNRLADAPAWFHCEDLTILSSSWVIDSLSRYSLLPAEKYQQ